MNRLAQVLLAVHDPEDSDFAHASESKPPQALSRRFVRIVRDEGDLGCWVAPYTPEALEYAAAVGASIRVELRTFYAGAKLVRVPVRILCEGAF